jgi:hypothetical protein
MKIHTWITRERERERERERGETKYKDTTNKME